MTERKVKAWVLQLGKHFRAAIAVNEMKQLQINQALQKVPFAPLQCQNMYIWQQHLLPIIDLNFLLENSNMHKAESNMFVVVRFSKLDANVESFAGLFVKEIPFLVSITDRDAAELPDEPVIWRTFAHSCFLYQGEKIPILNLSLLFSEKFCNLMESFYNFCRL